MLQCKHAARAPPSLTTRAPWAECCSWRAQEAACACSVRRLCSRSSWLSAHKLPRAMLCPGCSMGSSTGAMSMQDRSSAQGPSRGGMTCGHEDHQDEQECEELRSAAVSAAAQLCCNACAGLQLHSRVLVCPRRVLAGGRRRRCHRIEQPTAWLFLGQATAVLCRPGLSLVASRGLGLLLVLHDPGSLRLPCSLL